MDITYTPYYSEFREIAISKPTFDIIGYRPRYTVKKTGEEPVVAVESPIEEIKNPEPSNRERVVQQKPITKFKSKKEFKDTMTPIYERVLKERGLNPSFAKALVAQDGLESAWGSKPSGAFNFGGIKGKGPIKRTREVINGRDVYINDSFRDFDSLEDYAKFKVSLLNNSRYKAFSGSVDEFAERVHRGGYATAPNYADVLNRLIMTAKCGGILKFREGGLTKSKGWVDNWYKNRLPQIERNIKDNQTIPIPVTGTLGYHILKHNMDLTTASIDPSNVPEDANGVYYPFGRRIYLRTDSPTTAVHEWTHSSEPDAQIKEIDKIKKNLGKAFYDSSTSIPVSDYLDSSEEIYARLMALRQALGIDPKHEFTNEEVEKLKKDITKWTTLTTKLSGKAGSTFSTTRFDKNGKIIATDPYKEGYKSDLGMSILHREYDDIKGFNLLNRYSVDAIRMLFNNVAKDSTNKRDLSLYIKKGLKIPKFQSSGVLKSTYDDPDHYYDYSSGVYDSRTRHWSSRDPRTGMILKNPNHPTFYRAVLDDEESGYELYKDRFSGRYYTLKPNEYAVASNKLTLQRVLNDERRELLGRGHLDTWNQRSDFSQVVPGFTRETLADRKEPYVSTILKAAEDNNINPEILDALFTQESRHDPSAVSAAGAEGYGQLMPVNTRDIDPFDGHQNITRSAEVLDYFRDINGGNMKRAIAGYNGYTKPENAKKKMIREDSLERATGKRSDNYYEVIYDLIDSLNRSSKTSYPFYKRK